MTSVRRFASVLLFLLLAAPALRAQARGRLEGTVATREGEAIAGVSVALVELQTSQVTGPDGRFAFADVPAGTYSLALRLGEHSFVQSGVEVAAGAPTQVELAPDWRISFADSMTVYSASRKPERIVDAPAAVTLLGEEEIGLHAAAGQVPRLLEFTTGAQASQSGIYDYNFNTRGFNSFLNRRIQTLVDGRDVAIPFVSSQEWAAMSALADDLQSVELLRGPSAALYGPNTFNGVLNLVTKAPRESQGGIARVTAGDLATRKLDLRWAGGLGRDWYLKLLGGASESSDFARSRNRSVEYAGLAPEPLPLERDEIDVTSGSARLDKYMNGRLLTVEGGAASADGVTFLTAAGRSHAVEGDRSWARLDYNTLHFNLLGYLNDRDGEQLVLSAGTRSFLRDENRSLELQGYREMAAGRGRMVGGISYGEQDSDSADANGVQTLFGRAIHSDRQSVFGQLDYDLAGSLKAVLALRWDDSSLHGSQVSPKGSLVYGISPDHTLRLSYNQAFEVPTYAQYFLSLPAGPPLDLGAVESSLAPLLGGTSLGLGSVPLLALGNPRLEVEKIRSLELGYRGILGGRALLTADYYYNRMRDFITDLMPGANRDLAPYRAPAGLPPGAAQIVEQVLRSALPGLTNDPATGLPLFALSFGNTGRVDSQGLELGLTCGFGERWLADLTYSWFDFEVKEDSLGAGIHPNGPENSGSLRLTYRGDRLHAAIQHRRVEGFAWQSGIYAGPVPSYQVTDLTASYALASGWEVGLDVSNALDDEHYEVFGGDLLERRALGFVSYRW